MKQFEAKYKGRWSERVGSHRGGYRMSEMEQGDESRSLLK